MPPSEIVKIRTLTVIDEYTRECLALRTDYKRGADEQIGQHIHHLNGRKWPVDSVTRKILEGFGLSIGVPAAAVKQSFEEIRRRVRAAAPIIALPAAESLDEFINRFHEVVNNACLRILQE